MGHTEEWGIRHDIWHAWGPGRIARIRPPLHNTTSGGPPRAASRDGREGGADEVVDVGVVELDEALLERVEVRPPLFVLALGRPVVLQPHVLAKARLAVGGEVLQQHEEAVAVRLAQLLLAADEELL